jgi:hypothetical protein
MCRFSPKKVVGTALKGLLSLELIGGSVLSTHLMAIKAEIFHRDNGIFTVPEKAALFIHCARRAYRG